MLLSIVCTCVPACMWCVCCVRVSVFLNAICVSASTTPGQLFYKCWLNLTVLVLHDIEHRIPFDGITHFLPRLYLLQKLGHLLMHIEQVN